MRERIISRITQWNRCHNATVLLKLNLKGNKYYIFYQYRFRLTTSVSERHLRHLYSKYVVLSTYRNHEQIFQVIISRNCFDVIISNKPNQIGIYVNI